MRLIWDSLKSLLFRRRERLKWNLRASERARSIFNPIRFVDNKNPNERREESTKTNLGQTIIDLCTGDPTRYGQHLPPLNTLETLTKLIMDSSVHGYPLAVGMLKAREAVAQYLSSDEQIHYEAKDIILTHGCVHALEICFAVLASENDNILIPRPYFPSYMTLCRFMGIEARFYNLLADKQWKIDLHQLEKLFDKRTRAVLINSPSNPTGAVHSAEQLCQLIDICNRKKVPIISDEVYEKMECKLGSQTPSKSENQVFPGVEFHSVAPLSKDVPVLTCNSLSKRFACPGWRLGYIATYDPMGHFKESIRDGLRNFSTLILGPNSIAQASLPSILSETPIDYFLQTMEQIEIKIKVEEFDDFIQDDEDFVRLLLAEQCVSCLPGTIFGTTLPYVRIALVASPELMQEACDRITMFCWSHAKKR